MHRRKLTIASKLHSSCRAHLAYGRLVSLGGGVAVVELEAGEAEFEGGVGAGAGQVGFLFPAVVADGHDFVHFYPESAGE